jgi:Zn ribbon nucleic-acid-binding protein
MEAILSKNPAAMIAGKRCPTCKCRDLSLSLHADPPKVQCLCCGSWHAPQELEDVPKENLELRA